MIKKLLILVLSGIIISGIGTTSFAQTTTTRTRTKKEIELKEAARYNSTIEVSQEQQILFEQDVNLAYQRVENEENYIVELINNQSGNEQLTNTSMWEYNLNFLKQNYDILQSQSDTNMYFVDSYIEAYSIVLLGKNMPLEK